MPTVKAQPVNQNQNKGMTTETKAQHTDKLSVRCYPTFDNPQTVVIGHAGEAILKFTPLMHPTEAKEYARRLVHCWNCHQELLEALKQCMTEEGAHCMTRDNLEQSFVTMRHRINIITATAQAAILRATATHPGKEQP